LLVLITYDVSTVSPGGKKRLRKVAKECQNYGQRVQNSVFECNVDATQFASLKLKLEEIIDKGQDSLRFYQLGNNYKTKIEHIGVKESIDLDSPLIF
jgi:CRISPR-associated protein Cas2